MNPLCDYTFSTDGFTARPGLLDAAACKGLRDAIEARRPFRETDIFLSEDEWRASPQRRGNNPRPGRNLAEKLDTECVFGNEAFREEMKRVCGERWRVLDYKLVMGYPSAMLPSWLQDELGDRAVANLGEFVKPQFRDVTYFRGIDFHQDIIDWPDRAADFATVYVYLDTVGPNDSPLHVMPGSERIGAATFPHKLRRVSPNQFVFESDSGDACTIVDVVRLTGEAGDLFYWHPFTLHGTLPQANSEPRISLRILIDKNARADVGCELDQANARITGAASLARTQNDIDACGRVIRVGNAISEMIVA